MRSRYLGKTMLEGVPNEGDAAHTVAADGDTALRVRTLGDLMVWRGSDLIPAARWHCVNCWTVRKPE